MFKPALLLRQERKNLVELEYYGFIVLLNKEGKIRSLGDTKNYPFFHRSCAKPLQASLIKDFNTDIFYGLTQEEIAICCGSHAGEPVHIKVLKSILKKGGFNQDDLSCPTIPPLNNFENAKSFTQLHNNCSGKHSLMLLLCKQNGWNTKNYLDFEHPLQLKIREKIRSLCEQSQELPATLDGCMTPNYATSLEDLAKGFLNLYKTHPQLISAMKEYPYITGGKNRLDTHLMELSPQIAAKVGAGGLCAIVNTLTNESLVIKITDADMKARTIIALEALIQLNWVNINSINSIISNLLNTFFDKNIYTQTGVNVGEYCPCFDLAKQGFISA